MKLIYPSKSSGLIPLLLWACILAGCNSSEPAQINVQKQLPVATWSDLEVQRINFIRVSNITMRVDMMYLIKILKPDAYPFFFHFTDQAGNLVAQTDVPINTFSTGEVFWNHTITVPASVSKLRVVMGRYNPVNNSRVITTDGSSEIEIGLIDLK